MQTQWSAWLKMRHRRLSHIRSPVFAACPAFIGFPVMVDYFETDRNELYLNTDKLITDFYHAISAPNRVEHPVVGNIFYQFLPLVGIFPFTQIFFSFNQVRPMGIRISTVCYYNHSPSGSTTAQLVVRIAPSRGISRFRLKAGLVNHVHYVTGSRLKAASIIFVFRSLLPVGHSNTNQQYTSLSLLHSHYPQFRSNSLLPRNDDHTGLSTPDVCQKHQAAFPLDSAYYLCHAFFWWN